MCVFDDCDVVEWFLYSVGFEGASIMCGDGKESFRYCIPSFQRMHEEYEVVQDSIKRWERACYQITDNRTIVLGVERREDVK
jgi:hypothetical protein